MYVRPGTGETLIYQSTTPAGPWGAVTTTVSNSAAASGGPAIVYGVHVNGFNVLLNPTSIPSPSNSLTGGSSLTHLAPTSTIVPEDMTIEKNASKGAMAGMGVGAAATVIFVMMIGGLLVHRRKKTKSQLLPPMRIDSNNLALVGYRKTNGRPLTYEMPDATNIAPVV